MPDVSPRDPKDYHPLEIENTLLRAQIHGLKKASESQIEEIKRLNAIISDLNAQLEWNKRCDAEGDDI